MKLLGKQLGQSTLEYILVVGVVGVVIIGILTVGFGAVVPQVARMMCGSVDTASTSAPNCLESE